MKGFLIFLFSISSVFCWGQKIKILDSILKTPIENVNFKSAEIGISTNENGVVDISIFQKNDTVNISHLSYHSKKIIAGEISSIFYLSPRIKILPTIDFKGSKISVLSTQIIEEISPEERLLIPKSTAEILEGHLGITVQESQSGGGSPNFRGMEANRLLLVVDGIPLNNAIYRSGHLQASSTINPFFIQKIDLLSAPTSVAYGNGAMGGALLFHTKNNSLNENSAYFHQQYESSSNAVFLNFLTNYHNKKIAFTSGFSIKSVGNLKMGENRLHDYENWGKEPFATKGKEQLPTSYNQADFMHKIFYRANKTNFFILNTQYSTSTNISRFDKLNDIKNELAKYSDWYYGPQDRFLQSLKLLQNINNYVIDEMRTTLAFQNLNESRHKQKAGEDVFSNRFENVKVYDIAVDFVKKINNLNISYGVGNRYQTIDSKANKELNNILAYNTTRYPDGGSNVVDYFAYSQLKISLAKKLEMLIGARGNQNNLTANFNDSTFSFGRVNNKSFSFIKSALLAYKIGENTSIKASYYGGFRNPNIDDIGKVFSKNDKDVIVPNENLEPEYSDNLEVAINYKGRKFQLQIQLYKIKINNAISREYSTLNGVDSILFDGELMRIQMNKNIESASIDGLSFYGKYSPTKRLSFIANCNYLKGEASENKPLAHIPPFNANLALNYTYLQHEFEFYGKYNAWKYAKYYDKEGVDNLEEATIDGSPMWYTINAHYSYKIDKTLTIGIGVENMMDVHYKTFASGISASGRNLILSLHSKF